MRSILAILLILPLSALAQETFTIGPEEDVEPSAYPDSVQEAFLTACSRTRQAKACDCVLRHLKEEIPYEDFADGRHLGAALPRIARLCAETRDDGLRRRSEMQRPTATRTRADSELDADLPSGIACVIDPTTVAIPPESLYDLNRDGRDDVLALEDCSDGLCILRVYVNCGGGLLGIIAAQPAERFEVLHDISAGFFDILSHTDEGPTLLRFDGSAAYTPAELPEAQKTQAEPTQGEDGEEAEDDMDDTRDGAPAETDSATAPSDSP